MFLKNTVIIRLCCIYYFLVSIIGNCNINLILEGLNPELERDVRNQFSRMNHDVQSINIDCYKKQLENTIKSGLKPLGFYNPKINIFLDSLDADNKRDSVIIKIDPGKPIKITSINIHIVGDALYDSDYQQIIKDSQLFVGKRLNHNDYEQLKNKLYNLAIYKGYFDANLQNSELIVIPSLYKSIWNIYFNSGTRYLVEDVTFQGSHIKHQYLYKICNIHLGEYYNSEAIMEFNRRLSSTNWFESIFIVPSFIMCSQKKN